MSDTDDDHVQDLEDEREEMIERLRKLELEVELRDSSISDLEDKVRRLETEDAERVLDLEEELDALKTDSVVAEADLVGRVTAFLVDYDRGHDDSAALALDRLRLAIRRDDRPNGDRAVLLNVHGPLA